MLLTIIREYFTGFSRLKLFLIVFSFSVVTILLSLWFGGFAATAIVIVPAILSILQITKGVWTPESGSKSAIGLASLGIAFAAIFTNKAWRPLANSFLSPLFDKYPSLKEHLPSDSPSILGLVFLVVVILIVNYLARDTTVMKEHPSPIDKEFPERQYKHYLKDFCGVLLDDLNRIDRETNWSAESFTPLDAEVEVQSGSRRLKRITDLLGAIKSDRISRVFLVLGDPGSGKSVALRKLCRDLLQEVGATGRVPIYVNLREWERTHPWTVQSPPTSDQLYEFVFNNLKLRGDIFVSDFLDKYFKRMFENGRLFVVLDSFDEIPAVLDVDERSWLIERLSEVIYKFLAGAHQSRGVLASRNFRKPTSHFDARTILEIRPLSDLKIVEMLKKSLFFDETLITLLFSRRQEFIPIARNPFSAALISSYASEHSNQLPPTQAELYSTYIDRRLQACKDTIITKGLTPSRVVEAAVEIANVMLKTETLGLEASVELLAKTLPHHEVGQVVEILRYARLGRLGASGERRFSFVHRRFNEYFVVQTIKDHPERAPISEIPTDSRWRDALVLYCEIAEEKYAREIAEFCWREVSAMSESKLNMADPQFLRSVHCLRFLRDAFRARPIAIESFRDDLATLINKRLLQSDNLLAKKIAVEAVGLLQARDMDRTLTLALDLNSPWVNEIAFKSCHYLPRLSAGLSRRLQEFIENMNLFTFMRRQRELRFSLALSTVFGGVRTYCNCRVVDTCLLFIATLIFVVAMPVISVTLLAGFLVLRISQLFINYQRPNPRRKSFINSLFSERYLVPFGAFALLLTPLIIQIVGLPSDKPAEAKVSVHIAALVLILAIPYYRAVYLLKEHYGLRHFTTKQFFVGILQAVMLILFIGGFFWLLSKIPERVIFGLAVILLCVAIPMMLFSVAKYSLKRYRDSKKLRRLTRLPVLSREQIGQQFLDFETHKGRLQFVKLLDVQRVMPLGTWPTGRLPNMNDDKASDLLAKLEEKWLGLDR